MSDINQYNSGDDFVNIVKVPKERIAVLIGKKGETKTELEEALLVEINIDSKEGDVEIKSTESINLMVANDVVKAIARGFNPDIAKKLASDEYFLEIITLNDYSSQKNHHQRLKGRVIGREGRSRNLIEEYTGCYISVYGKTVGIVGRNDTVSIAKRAVEMIIEGSPHSSVYRFLEKKRKDMKRSSINTEEEIDDKFKKFADE